MSWATFSPTTISIWADQPYSTNLQNISSRANQAKYQMWKKNKHQSRNGTKRQFMLQLKSTTAIIRNKITSVVWHKSYTKWPICQIAWPATQSFLSHQAARYCLKIQEAAKESFLWSKESWYDRFELRWTINLTTSTKLQLKTPTGPWTMIQVSPSWSTPPL